jgi:hypothetical protein
MIRTDLVKKIQLWQKLYPRKTSCEICVCFTEGNHPLCKKLKSLYREKYEESMTVGARCVIPFLNDEDFRI